MPIEEYKIIFPSLNQRRPFLLMGMMRYIPLIYLFCPSSIEGTEAFVVVQALINQAPPSAI